MNKFLISALISTGLGLGFAPVANSQTSDTAEVEFTGTLEASCEIFNIQDGTLGFSFDSTLVTTDRFGGSPGSFEFSEGCRGATIMVSSSTVNNLRPSIQIRTVTNSSPLFFFDSIGISLTNSIIRRFELRVTGSNDNNAPFLPGEYSIIFTAVLTPN